MEEKGPIGRLGTRMHNAIRRLSLRARLLLGLVLVASIGLVVADVVVYGQIDSYLNTQIDNELQSGASTVVSALNRRPGDLTTQLPLNTAAKVVLYNGTVEVTNPQKFQLAIPTALFTSIVKVAETSSRDFSFFTTTGKSVGPTAPYRVLPVRVAVESFGQTAPAIAFIAIPLDSLIGTLHQLIVVGIAVSAGVIVLLGLLGYLVVRVGLRPLREIEDTAESIAEGDLSQRVERADTHTEVGRLGASLNTMLGHIERAFTEQRVSEDRLRQFLADASHELRTPVTSIRGYAELFRRGAADRPEDLALAMRRIEDESARMGGLVDDLLFLARLDQGRPLEMVSVDIANIATDAAFDAAIVAPERSIHVDTIPAIVRGDEQRLRQIVMNLVQNALRHTPPEVAVAVRVYTQGKNAVLTVHDDGPGIPPEHVGRIFERFYRGDPSRTRESGGSGLGLAIVASIADAHGGTARVESVVGRGSTFIVELPLNNTQVLSPRELSEPVGSADDNGKVGDDLRQLGSTSGDDSVGSANSAAPES